MKKEYTRILLVLICIAAGVAYAQQDFQISIRASLSEAEIREREGIREVPLYVGVPFPRGMLTEGDSVRVLNADGEPVPSHARVMALWPGTRQVRWLGVDFQGNPEESYLVVRGTAKAPQQKLNLKKQGEDYWIDTGVARYHIPAKGPLIGQLSVWKRDKEVWEIIIRNSGGDDLYVIDQNGREGIAGRDQSAGQLTVESEDSPLHVTLRREGGYVTVDGVNLARHITRIHFYAGEVGCRIEHTLVLTEDTDQLWLKDYGLRLRWPGQIQAQEVVYPASEQRNAEWLRYPLQGWQRIGLLQRKAFWLSRMDPEQDCLFEVSGEKPDGTVQNLHQGRLAGDWIYVNTNTGGMGVTLRKLWQHFPKELSVTRDGLQIHLWSGSGGDEMDMRLSTLLERWPEEWLNEEYHEKVRIDALKAAKVNGVGVARTHEILLSPVTDQAMIREFIADSHQFSDKILFYPDPWWLRKSEAMGRFHPYDPERFPEEEGFMENWFDQYHEIHEQWGNYGFFDYGAGPHVWYKQPNDGPLAGQWIPFLNRYSLKDYGFHAHLWRMFVRSGKRKYYDAAEKYTRQRLEVAMNHVDWKGKIKGTYQAFPVGPTFWGTRSSFHNDSGTDIRSFAYLYYTTDYRLAREMLGHYGEAIKRVWNSPNQGPIRGTRPFASLKNIATVYQETGDEELKSIMDIQTEWLADLNAPQGVSIERELTRLGKYGVKSGAMHRVWEVSGNETAAASLLKGATTYARNSLGGGPLSYFNSIAGEQVSTAWYLTEDPLFARTLLRDMRLAVTYYQKDDGSGWKPMYNRYPVAAANVYPLGGMAFAMDAVCDYVNRHGQMPDLPPYARVAGFGRKVLVAFEKSEGKSVYLDVRSRRAIAPVVYDARGKPVELVVATPFTDQLYSLEAVPTRYELRIPEELPAGVYLLDSGGNGEMWEVTWTDAEKIVMLAPGGVVIGSGGRMWGDRITSATSDHLAWVYFHVPANTRLFQIFSSEKATLRTPDGTLSVIGEEAGFERIRIPAGMDDSFWAIRVDSPSFVQWIGLPFQVAYGTADRFFDPGISREVLSDLGLEFTPRGQQPVTVTDSRYGSEEDAIGGSQGVVLSAGRYLVLPDRTDGSSPVEWLQSERGTLEFWLRPLTSSVFQFGQSSAVRTLLSAGTWNILLHRYGEMSLTTSATHAKDSPIQSNMEHNAGVVLENDRWTHIAIQWDADRGQRFWEIFINGVSSSSVRLADEDGNPVSGEESVRFLAEKPAERLVIGANASGRSSLNGILAGLRVSREPRYHQNFIPDPGETMRMDSITSVLFRFDGNLDGQTGTTTPPLRGQWVGQ